MVDSVGPCRGDAHSRQRCADLDLNGWEYYHVDSLDWYDRRHGQFTTHPRRVRGSDVVGFSRHLRRWAYQLPALNLRPGS